MAVSGRLNYSEWEADGQKRSKHEVIADRVEFLSSGAPEDNGPRCRKPASSGRGRLRMAARRSGPSPMSPGTADDGEARYARRTGASRERR